MRWKVNGGVEVQLQPLLTFTPAANWLDHFIPPYPLNRSLGLAPELVGTICRKLSYSCQELNTDSLVVQSTV
jgi:hypothetical protein